MRVETIAMSKINPAPYNPRLDLKPGDADYEKIRKSIETFDLVEPLVWNERTGTLIGGHQRLKILQARGDKKVEVSVVDLEPDMEKALNLALNKTGGDWDLPKLKDVLEELDTGDFDMDITGFDVGEIEDLMTQFHVDGDDEEEDVPELPEEPETKVGDLLELGPHRVLCGDAILSVDVKHLMEGTVADLMLTDPPYGVSYGDKNEYLNAIGRGNRIQENLVNDTMKPTEMTELWTAAFTQALEVVRDGGAYYCCSPQGGDLMMMMMMSLLAAGWQLKQTIIWVKNNIVLGRSDYNYQHEPLLYGWKKGSHKFYGAGGASSVWNVDKPQQSKLHPTMKPLPLFEKAINNSSRVTEVIYDPFLGSGTTLIAAEKLGRVCYGMEIDPRYCDVIKKRYENYHG